MIINLWENGRKQLFKPNSSLAFTQLYLIVTIMMRRHVTLRTQKINWFKNKINHYSNFWKKVKVIIFHTSVCANLALSTFCASAQTDNLGTARLGLSFESLSLLSCEQSWEELHFFLSSAANCCCWLAFRPERPQPVMLPRREKARITIGDEGTLLGLKIKLKEIIIPRIGLTIYFIK